MNEWEYCEVTGNVCEYGNSQFMLEIKSRGAEGWELVSIAFIPTGMMFEHRAIGVMKRQVKQ